MSIENLTRAVGIMAGYRYISEQLCYLCTSKATNTLTYNFCTQGEKYGIYFVANV